jgi:hypothetical protein
MGGDGSRNGLSATGFPSRLQTDVLQSGPGRRHAATREPVTTSFGRRSGRLFPPDSEASHFLPSTQ